MRDASAGVYYEDDFENLDDADSRLSCYPHTNLQLAAIEMPTLITPEIPIPSFKIENINKNSRGGDAFDNRRMS